MKNLLLSSFLFILLFACKFGHYGKLKEATSNSGIPPTSIFGDKFNSFLFKTNITVYGKNFSGLLITKQLQPNDFRVVFTTELGMKLFDFGFKDTSFTLHYCVPQFNRPKLLKTIQNDIEVLLMNDLKNKQIIDLVDKQGIFKIKKIQFASYSNYYFVDSKSEQLVKIEKANKRIKKNTFVLTNYINNFPSNIMITHHDIKLKIELNHLKKE